MKRVDGCSGPNTDQREEIDQYKTNPYKCSLSFFFFLSFLSFSLRRKGTAEREEPKEIKNQGKEIRGWKEKDEMRWFRRRRRRILMKQKRRSNKREEKEKEIREKRKKREREKKERK